MPPIDCFFLLATRAQNVALGVGCATLAAGVLLLISHRRELDQQLDNTDNSDFQLRFEKRKYRRRATSSSLIASVGVLVAGLFWVNESRVFFVFVSLILLLLGVISVLAMIDFFSVSLQQLANPDERTQKALLEEMVRKHRESKQNTDSQD